MVWRLRVVLRIIVALALIGLLICAGVVFLPQFLGSLEPERIAKNAVAESSEPAVSPELVAGQPDTLRLPAQVGHDLGVQLSTVVPSTTPESLELPGTLILDADRLSHVHARFGGEVVEIGTPAQPVGFGEAVRKGQLLAVLWSRDMGEKKSELVDALSQLHLDQANLTRLIEASADGAIAERSIREAKRKVDGDEIAVSRVVRTLQSWRVPEEEIQAVRAEAERLRTDNKDAQKPQNKQTREEFVQQWARVEVQAPLDGVVLERNVVLGDLVDTNIDLFQIADLSRLRVIAHAYEENLPALDALPTDQRRWSVAVAADPQAGAQEGRFDQIGRIIDPNQHTALVMGWVDNARGKLRVGQFITARVALVPGKNEVTIPVDALMEQGDQHLVIVQAAESDCYARRKVAVARRAGATVIVRNELTDEERRHGLQPLHAGEHVVSSGAVQLTAKLDELQQSAAAGK